MQKGNFIKLDFSIYPLQKNIHVVTLFQMIVSKNMRMQRIMMIWILSTDVVLKKRDPIVFVKDVHFAVNMKWMMMIMNQKVNELLHIRQSKKQSIFYI